MAGLVINGYANAIFDIAKEDNKLEGILEDTNTLNEIIKTTDFYLLIKSSSIEKNIKKEIVKKTLNNKLQKIFIDFILLLIDKNRINLLDSINLEISRLIKEELLIGVVNITSCYELNENTKEKIRNSILKNSKYKTLEEKYFIDKRILGGLKIEINNYIYDDTIISKVTNLKKQLLLT